MRLRTAIAAAIAVAVLGIVAVVAFAGGGTPAHTDTSPTGWELPALTGSNRVTLAEFRGRPVVVTLFASWCAECRAELPAFAAEARELSGRVQFVGVDSEETGDGKGMAAHYGLAAAGFVLAHDVGAGQSGLHDALHAPGMPVTVFYDATGRVLGKAVLSLPPDDLHAKLHAYYGV